MKKILLAFLMLAFMAVELWAPGSLCTKSYALGDNMKQTISVGLIEGSDGY